MNRPTTEYRITVKTFTHYREHVVLTYTVDEYEVIDGFIEFTDRNSGTTKRFDARNVEITVVDHDSR
jgi:hypothetical protein